MRLTLAFVLWSSIGCGGTAAQRRRPRPLDVTGFQQDGIASYYADRFEGRPTASGAPYRARELTAAHRTLPFGTCVEVTRVEVTRDNLRVLVRITDRGPFGNNGRIIDLSRRAAEQLHLLRAGVAQVHLRVVPCG